MGICIVAPGAIPILDALNTALKIIIAMATHHKQTVRQKLLREA